MRDLRSELLEEEVREVSRWPTYLGILGLLLVLLVVVAGGIIWYNSKKSSSLAVTAAEQMMQQAEDKVTERIELLYDPMFAIVGVASLMPQFTTPAVKNDPQARELLLRALRIYPQILSLYVGFDDGDFLMVTHITGAETETLRKKLQTPDNAVFAIESISTDPAGKRLAQWTFLDESGDEISKRDPTPTAFDPRERPWYRPAKESDTVQHSDLYVFASNGEPGFTLSRSFAGPTPGVMGADLGAKDLATFLREQRVTPNSVAFIFTKSGEIVAMPDQAAVAKATRPADDTTSPPPKVGDLKDPVIGGFVAAYKDQRMTGAHIYDVAGRPYIARVAEIPPRYGRDQLLAILVPFDEIEQPINDIRNQTLLYSIGFLVFVLPLYATLIVIWIDRRLRQIAR